MNKIYFLLLCGFIFLQSCSSSFTGTPVQVEPMTKVIQVPDKGKNELYVSANNWMAETFNSAKSVIQFKDKESGVVTGRYLLKPGYTYRNYQYIETEEGSAYAIIKIQVKDGASKITVDPQEFTERTSDMLNDYYKFSRQDAIRESGKLMASFENYIKNDTSQEW